MAENVTIARPYAEAAFQLAKQQLRTLDPRHYTGVDLMSRMIP